MSPVSIPLATVVAGKPHATWLQNTLTTRILGAGLQVQALLRSHLRPRPTFKLCRFHRTVASKFAQIEKHNMISPKSGRILEAGIAKHWPNPGQIWPNSDYCRPKSTPNPAANNWPKSDQYRPISPEVYRIQPEIAESSQRRPNSPKPPKSLKNGRIWAKFGRNRTKSRPNNTVSQKRNSTVIVQMWPAQGRIWPNSAMFGRSRPKLDESKQRCS